MMLICLCSVTLSMHTHGLPSSNQYTSPQFSTSSTSIQAEQKMEQKRRGNKDTQTSDAKFDEQFKLGHQMASQVHIS